MEALFSEYESQAKPKDFNSPLAERMRPSGLEDFAGQEHLFGPGAPLRKFIESGEIPSIILWGPPGVGKTTIAMMIAAQTGYRFIRISAVESGVKEIRDIISKAEAHRRQGKSTILFIDEIHRFNKSQQDALLHALEKGIITLIGATTENPSFEVNAALISRSSIYRLLPLTDADIRKIVGNALAKDKKLKEFDISIEDMDHLVQVAGGDARTALNALELGLRYAYQKGEKKITLTREHLENALQQKTAKYDKKGENHYDTISAFIKSMRGSDPDASLFWLAKMLDAGEDPKFIARRMLVFASEDIGNADPAALGVAVDVFYAVTVIGIPECRINLAQGVTYLASAPKSNASYTGIESALADIRKGADISVPLHLRNAPTSHMKQEGYGEDYKYPHSYRGNFVEENYFPEGADKKLYYDPDENGYETQIKKRLSGLWPHRYGKEKNE